MSATLMIRDETASGKISAEIILEVLTERMTVREMIRSRVKQEVSEYNSKRPEVFRGLIEPTDAEKALNGYRLRKRREIDWEKQYLAALEAFKQNQIIIVIGEKQAETLDDEIVVSPGTCVSFLKLAPLVGG
jgi:hypothetical protein